MSRGVEGSTIVITGGSSGIGAAAARMLAERGARLIITGRSKETHRVAEETGADAHLVDFASFTEVEQFARALLERYPRIDVLVNNVGALFDERRVTEDGHEMTLQVNHLSGFLLTDRLRTRLEESNAVVINTSSMTHTRGRLDFGNLEGEGGYNGFRAYATAKLMNILHAMEVDRRYDGVHGVSFHPGGVATGFAREASGFMRWIYEGPIRRLLLTSPEKGADTLVWLARGTPGEDWTPREYYAKRKPARKGSQVDPERARKLWEVSEELIGQTSERG